MRLLVLIASLALLSGCGGGTSEPKAEQPTTSEVTSEAPRAFQATGVFAINDPGGVLVDGYRCQGDGGYDDLYAGTQVVVRDASSTQVAIGELGLGAVQEDGTCEFALMVFSVPPSSDIYTIEVANRGEISFTQEDAAKGLSLSVG